MMTSSQCQAKAIKLRVYAVETCQPRYKAQFEAMARDWDWCAAMARHQDDLAGIATL